MVLRAIAIVTVFLVFVNCKPASYEKSVKCDYCKHFIKTGLSPYEVLWTLKEEIGRALPSQVLEKKMLMKTEDIKMAEGVFLVYCRHNCRKLFEDSKGDEAAKSLAKKGKILHFLSTEDEEKFTRLAKQEFAKNKKKKSDKHVTINYVRKKVKQAPKENSKKPKPQYDETDEKYFKLYQNVLFGTEALSRLSAARSLLDLKDSGNSSTPVPEVNPRQSPEANTTSEAKPTETMEMNTTEIAEPATESPKETTTQGVVTELPTTPKPEKGSSQETEEKEDSDYDDVFSENSEDNEESKKPSKTSDKTDGIGDIIKELINFTTGDDSISSISKSILEANNFLNCIIDLLMTEIETALNIPSGLLVREKCDKSLQSSLSRFNLSSILAPLKSNIQTQKIACKIVPPVQNIQGYKGFGYPSRPEPIPNYQFAPPGFQQGPPVLPPPVVGNYYREPPPFFPFGTSRSLSPTRYPCDHFPSTSGSVETFRDYAAWKKTAPRYPYSTLEEN